jgi:hypothetical protein
MCCFSGPVEDVSNTKIFARFVGRGEQALVYQMHYKAAEPLAMILPIPVGSQKEDAVTFVDLSEYERFFDDMHLGFPEPRPRGAPLALADPPKLGGLGALEVVEVGSFEASFVPTVKDFDRLDERFRLPKSTWDKLPRYRDYGFAVFQLKSENESVHPMAFRFPTVKANSPLFFPTVHIHDGEVHAAADFDHTLYLQPRDPAQMLPRGWEESPQPASMFLEIEKTQKLVDGKLHCYRRKLHGKLKNVDTLVA